MLIALGARRAVILFGPRQEGHGGPERTQPWPPGGDPIGWRSLGNRKRGGPPWGHGGDPVVGGVLEALVVRLGLGALVLAMRRWRQRQPIEQSG